jgi:Mlc titration factor MtfA (ptsG expression regulator)
MSKKDFDSKAEYKEYKENIRNAEKTADNLASSIKTEANIQTAIDDFKATDPTNFNLANNLTFKDSSGATQNLDITIQGGRASEFGGAVTRVSFEPNADKSYKSIFSIDTILDFRTVKPISNVLAHEMAHAYDNAQNPVQGMQDTTTINCQDSANRNSFQSKTAVDWQEHYDTPKALKIKK